MRESGNDNSHPWLEVKEIVADALELPTEKRETFLRQRCGSDATLRAEVEQLLLAYDEAESFLGEEISSGQVDAAGFEARTDPLLASGTWMGPYQVVKLLGEGGFGSVYLAEQRKPIWRQVALKVIKPGMDSRQIVARFEAERQALALMDHPNIARVLDAGATDHGLPFFAMEFVNGIPITEFCDQQKLSMTQRLQLFVDVCRAVQHAHQKGIIHRDLKPSNVMVALHDKQPVAKVIDFGVAKAIGQKNVERTTYTAAGQVLGTPLYMSPEQAQLDGLDVDTRSDVYSLGVLLYEILTGTTPFDRDTLLRAAFDEMRRIIREEEPPRPSARVRTLAGNVRDTVAHRRCIDARKLDETLAGELDWVVMKCLEKDRARRYETASDLARDIERYVSEKPVEARPASAVYRLRKFVRRNRWPLAAGALILACLGALVIGALLYASEQRQLAIERANLAEEREQARRETESTLYWTLLGRAEALRTARTVGYRGEVFEYLHEAAALDVPERNLEEIREQVLACLGDPIGLDPIKKPSGIEPIQEVLIPDRFRAFIEVEGKDRRYRVAMSADGKWFAFYRASPSDDDEHGRELTIRDSNGEVVGMTVPPLGAVNVLVFTTDGRSLIAGCESGTIVWRVPDFNLQASFRGSPVKSITVHPYGQQLATLSETGRIEIWSLASNRVLSSLEASKKAQRIRFSADGSLLLGLAWERGQIVEAWPINRTPEKRYFIGHRGGVADVGFSPNGRLLASASEDRTVGIWDLGTGRLVRTLTGHSQEVQSVAFHPAGDLLASGSGDGTLVLWHVESGRRAVTQNDVGAVSTVEFDASGRTLVAGGSDGVVSWEVRPTSAGAEMIRSRTIRLPGVIDVAVCPDGLLVAARLARSLHLYDLKRDSPPRRIDDGHRLYSTLHFDRSGKRVFFGMHDGRIGVWDCKRDILERRTESRVEPNHHGYTADDRWVATRAADRLMVFELESETTELTLPPENRRPNGVSWSPDGRLLAVGFPDGMVVVWDLERVRAELHKFGVFVRSTVLTSKTTSPALTWKSSEVHVARRSDAEIRRSAQAAAKSGDWARSAAEYATVLERTSVKRGWKTPRVWLCEEIVRSDELFTRVVGLRPDDPDLWVARGRLLLRQGLWQEAYAALQRIVGKSPPVGGVNLFEYAALALFVGDNTSYRRIVTRMVRELSTGSPGDRCSLARAAAVSPDPPVDVRGIVKWAEAGVAGEDRAHHRHALALAHLRAGAFERAITTARESNSRDWHEAAKAQNWLVMALAAQRQGNDAKARDFLAEARSRLKANSAKHRADRMKYLTDLLEAEILLREAEALISPEDELEQHPRTRLWYRERALIHARLEQWDESAADFVRAINLPEDAPSAGTFFIPVYQALVPLKEVFDRVAKLRPGDFDLWLQRGRYYAVRSRWDLAVQAYRGAKIHSKPLGDPTWEFACLLVLAGDQDGYRQLCSQVTEQLGEKPRDSWWAKVCQAGTDSGIEASQIVEAATRALREDGGRAWALHDLGMAEYRAARYEDAVRHLQESNASKHSPIRHNSFALSLAYHRMGRKDESRKWYEKGLVGVQRRAEAIRKSTPVPDIPPHWIYLNLLHREASQVLETPASEPVKTGSAARE